MDQGDSGSSEELDIFIEAAVWHARVEGRREHEGNLPVVHDLTAAEGTPLPSAVEEAMPIEVFISYSHKDGRWKDRIVEQVGVLERESLVSAWHDGRIAAAGD
ncbi:MAG: hypothetical protein WAN65_10265 [Candidatus Sulfotelmatobacter sp.]